MKLRLFTIAFFILSSLGFAQDKKALEKAAQNMYSYTVNAEYAQLIDLYYPKIFEALPKDKMLAGMQGMTKGNGYTMIMVSTPPNFTFGDIKQIDGGSYSLVSHDMVMKMIFNEPINDADGKAMVENFKKSMDTNSVTFNEKEHSFIIKKRNEVIFIANAITKNNWMFVNKYKRELLVTLLGEKPLKQLGI